VFEELGIGWSIWNYDGPFHIIDDDRRIESAMAQALKIKRRSISAAHPRDR